MSLHDFLRRYFTSIAEAVAQLTVYTESYVEEILSDERANLRIRLRFQNGSLLEINEAVVVEDGKFKTLGYRYHMQNSDHALLFRYDNTPHFPALATFPHHKHLSDSVIANSKPDLLEVLQEAKRTS